MFIEPLHHDRNEVLRELMRATTHGGGVAMFRGCVVTVQLAKPDYLTLLWPVSTGKVAICETVNSSVLEEKVCALIDLMLLDAVPDSIEYLP